MDTMIKVNLFNVSVNSVIIKSALLILALLSGVGVLNLNTLDSAKLSNMSNDSVLTILEHGMFSGYLILVLMTLIVYVTYMFWQLHKVSMRLF